MDEEDIGPHKASSEQHASSKMLDGIISGENGSILGGLFHLPKPLVALYNIFMPDVKLWVSGKLAELGPSGVVASYVLPHIDSVFDLNHTRKQHYKNRKAVLAPVSRLLAVNKTETRRGLGLFRTGYEGNAIIEDALHTVTSITYSHLVQNASNLIPNIMVNYGTRKKIQIDQLEKQITAPGTANLAVLKKTLEGHRKQHDFAQKYGTKAAGAVQTAVQEYADAGTLQKRLKDMTYGKVQDLRDYLHDNELDGPRAKGRDGDDHVEEVSRLVAEAFQQFQKERGWRHIPSHRMHEVAKLIAEELVHGEMNGLSLYNIIGRGELLNRDKTGVLGNDKVKRVLHREIALFPRRSTMDVGEFLDKSNYTLEDVRSHLRSKDKNERALTVLLHSDSEPVLLKAGLKHEEIKDLKAHLSQHFAEELMWAAITGLAKKSDEELRAEKFDNEDIDALRNYAENRNQLKRALQNAERGEDAKDLVRRKLMGQQSDYVHEILSGKSDRVKTRAADKQESEETPSLRGRENGDEGRGDKDSDSRLRSREEEPDEMPTHRAREEARREYSGDDDRERPKTPLEHARREPEEEEAYRG